MTMQIGAGTGPSWFTPKAEEESESPSKFQIKPLTGEQMTELFFILDDDLALNYQASKLLIKYGLIGWSGLEDHEGTNLEFSAEAIKMIPPLLSILIAGEIFKNSQLTVRQTKNS